MYRQLITAFLCGVAFCQSNRGYDAVPSPQVAQIEVGRTGAINQVSNTDVLIRTLQEQVKAHPQDASPYDRLGAAYFQKARETGDIEYYELAKKALAQSIEFAGRSSRAADPFVHMSLVYMGEHRFDDALGCAQRAMATGAGNLQALAIAGDAYTDKGDYEQAAAAYAKLQMLGDETSSPLAVTYMHDSRAAFLDFVNGDPPTAIGKMKSAIVAALQLNASGENLAWLYYELGERSFQAGDIADAEKSYEAGIKASPHHYRSLAGLAKVRAAQGHYEEAAKLYDASIAVIPMPQYIAELGDLYEKMGRVADAQRQYDLVEYIAYISKLNAELNNRELAQFYADREIKLDEALNLAKAEFAVRHDIYTWDTLAWAQYKNHQPAAAEESMKQALRLHTADPVLFFHAGMIYHSVGDELKAEEYLERALAINPRFHVLHADEATRTLAEIARTRTMRSSNE